MALLWIVPVPGATSAQQLTYTAFVGEVTANKVATATVTDTGAVSGTLVGGAHYVSTIPTALGDSTLAPLLLAHKVQVTGTVTNTTSILGIVFSLVPYLLLGGWLLWMVRRSRQQLGGGGALGGIMGIGRSKAKVYDEDRPTTRFADIAGYESAKDEVMEVVDFLKHPDRYTRAGAVGPKGVLMSGPPVRARRCWPGRSRVRPASPSSH
jgi:cell division protease FtsH